MASYIDMSLDNHTDETQQVVAASEIKCILKEQHDTPTAGHYGIERTIQKIEIRYYWEGMRREECEKYKPMNMKPAGLLQTAVISKQFEVLPIAMFGPLPTAPIGVKWILVEQNYLH